MHWDSILAAVLSLAVVIGLLIFFLKPHWTLKIIVWLLRHTVVNLRVIGGANIPESGPVLIVSNHVSLIDLLLIQSISPRPVRFMIQQEVLEFVPTRFIFWYLGVIKVPNLRNPEERDAWRHDNACTNRAVAGDEVLPCSSYPERELSKEQLDANRAAWLATQQR